jgi:trans-aconitate 2-methyltransferase
MSWNPALYLKFGAERTRPAADLLARVPLDAPARVVDLGCGPGNSTALIAARYPQADILGLDSSAEMISEAKASGVGARFEIVDFEAWSPAPAPPDLIYANAAFQWAKAPVALVVRLLETLAPDGALAFQVPQNFDQPSHAEVSAAAEDGPWAEKLRAARRYDPGFAKAADYARALSSASLDIWTTEYLHVLSGPDPVFGWMSGTGLRPFLDALEGSERDAFAGDVRARLAAAYPPEPDGRTLFPFRRLFVIAVKRV